MNSLIKSLEDLAELAVTNFVHAPEGEDIPCTAVVGLGKFTISIRYYSNPIMNIYKVYLEKTGNSAWTTNPIVCFSKCKDNNYRVCLFDEYALNTVPDGLMLRNSNTTIIKVPYPVSEDNRFVISTYVPDELIDLITSIDFAFSMNFKSFEMYHKEIIKELDKYSKR